MLLISVCNMTNFLIFAYFNCSFQRAYFKYNYELVNKDINKSNFDYVYDLFKISLDIVFCGIMTIVIAQAIILTFDYSLFSMSTSNNNWLDYRTKQYVDYSQN
jgi:hypothetical protein